MEARLFVVVPLVMADVAIYDLSVTSEIEVARGAVAGTWRVGHGRLLLLLASLLVLFVVLMGGQGSDSKAC